MKRDANVNVCIKSKLNLGLNESKLQSFTFHLQWFLWRHFALEKKSQSKTCIPPYLTTNLERKLSGGNNNNTNTTNNSNTTNNNK